MFKLLQHAQNTISDANKYADSIEGMVHDLYMRGDMAHLTIRVKKEEDIPAHAFYSLGAEILNLTEDYCKQNGIDTIDFNKIITKANVNSKGSIQLKGNKKYVLLAAVILTISILGGGVNIPLPGGAEPISIEINGLLNTVSDFLNDGQQREHREIIIQQNADKLQVETPQEIKLLLDSVEYGENE